MLLQHRPARPSATPTIPTTSCAVVVKESAQASQHRRVRLRCPQPPSAQPRIGHRGRAYDMTCCAGGRRLLHRRRFILDPKHSSTTSPITSISPRNWRNAATCWRSRTWPGAGLLLGLVKALRQGGGIPSTSTHGLRRRADRLAAAGGRRGRPLVIDLGRWPARRLDQPSLRSGRRRSFRSEKSGAGQRSAPGGGGLAGRWQHYALPRQGRKSPDGPTRVSQRNAGRAVRTCISKRRRQGWRGARRMVSIARKKVNQMFGDIIEG